MASPDELRRSIISPGGLAWNRGTFANRSKILFIYPPASTNKPSAYCVPGTVPGPGSAAGERDLRMMRTQRGMAPTVYMGTCLALKYVYAVRGSTCIKE